MRLYIMRHAETEFNRKGIIQGSEVDSSINNVGDYQAERFYNFYKNINFDKIYVSGLRRTYQTIIRFVNSGIQCEKLDEFNEISWGVNQGKSDNLDEYENLIKTWINGDLDNKFKSGESPNEMSKRLIKGFNHVISEGFSTVLLCIHGRALRILLSKIIDNDLTRMDKYVHSNTGLYIIDSNKKGKYEIVSRNLRNHLA
ncbi:MAG: histidine phosphatase family protein [Bacteroidota bacterium]|nr:histidine phosphatase family protein [Bacteroidota bacterium]